MRLLPAHAALLCAALLGCDPQTLEAPAQAAAPATAAQRAPAPVKPRAEAARKPTFGPQPPLEALDPDSFAQLQRAAQPQHAPPPTQGPDFTAVFRAVSPSVLGLAAGTRDAQGLFRPQRTGTAFVWDDQGHCVTNAHLIGDSTELRLRRPDGQVRQAELIALDEPMDLALLRVTDLDLPPLPRAPQGSLQPGQWVAALGNPYGLAHSITVGIVSALGRRDLPGDVDREGWLVQIDLHLNPGSSGGPLTDTLGRVVGLNTAMLSDAQGLSFATPIEMVETVIARFLSVGHFERGFGGLTVRAVSPKAAQAAQLDRPQGARIGQLVEGGPAQRAGLLVGDIILAVKGEPLESQDQLSWRIAHCEPGSTVPLLIARGPQRFLAHLQIEASPAAPP